MTANSLYETPRILQEYVLQERGLPLVAVSGTAQNRRIAEALDGLHDKWKAIVDRSTFGELNDLMGIRLAANGRLVTQYHADHNYRNGVLVGVPYRFVNKELTERFLAEYIDWVEAHVTTRQGLVTKITFRPKVGTSTLRVRAFMQAVAEAHAQLGNVIEPSAEGMTVQGREAYIDGHYYTAVQLHQLYWPLAIAKEVATNLMPLMRAALAQGRAAMTANEPVRRDTSGAFIEFIGKRQKELRAVAAKRKSIENLPIIQPADTTTPRTWGIEIEAAGARGVAAPDGWDRKGDGSLRSAYSEGYRDPLNCPEHNHDEEDDDYEDPEYCGWVESGIDDEDDDYDAWGSNASNTAEFVSPILNTAGSPALEELLEALRREPQNDSAGVHVHVDAADLTARNVGALVFAYSVIEPIIEKAYFRNRRNYCKERKAEDILQVVKSSKTPGIRKSYRADSEGTGPTMHYGERYTSVNLNALEAHGTIEFRAMGPVYRYDHLIKWALFVREMVSIAKLNLPAKVWTSVKTWRDLEKVLYKYGTELPANELRRMEAELGTTGVASLPAESEPVAVG